VISLPEPRGFARAARRVTLVILLACGAWLLSAPAALAAAPAWSITSQAVPTNLPVGDQTGGDNYQLIATNTGATATTGTVTLTDTLPNGLTADFNGPHDNLGGPNAFDSKAGNNLFDCTTVGQTVTCTDPGPVPPGGFVEMLVPVDNSATGPQTVTNTASVSGGGAATASTTEPTTISDATPAFDFLPGAAGLSDSITNADGSPDTQAGSHPYQTAVNFGVSTGVSNEEFPIEDPQELTVNLPAGLAVNPNATPVRCTEAQLESDPSGGCPVDSAVGTDVVDIGLFGIPDPFSSAVYNMVPPAGVPAEFGFALGGLGVFEHLTGSVRTGGDYGLTATINPLIQEAGILHSTVTLWGNPSDPSHDAERGPCAHEGTDGTCPVSPSLTPLLTMPSTCSGPLTTTASMNSWQHPGTFLSASAQTTDSSGNPVGVTGCDNLDFTPSITVQPDTSVADSPSGLHVDLSVPQPQNQQGLAEGNLKTAVVTLPAGMSVNPSAAAGLASCTPTQIGLDNASEPSCPDASKIGSVQVDTPLLPDPLQGGIYVAQQNNNPFRSLLAIYVTAEADGALIKLAGHVVADPVTGQLTTTFDNNPQLPFTDFKLDFFGGPRGVLATPESCGTYTASSSLSPWSGTPAVTRSDAFDISSGCMSGFSPAFAAGTQNAQAGAYAPFVLSFSRSDTDQNFSGLSVQLPPGLLAKLAGVQECSDAQVATAASDTGAQEQANPSCPAGSQVGTVTTSAGTGPDPTSLTGNAYLTGPYKGAPYGIAVVVPAVAGPYDLGTVVVRQALFIDPETAQVTDVSDPFPTILQGIQLRIRSVAIDLNRPDFTVNPTSCNPMSVTGTLTSTGDLTYAGDSHFQVGGCQDIGFSPKLKLALTGKGKTKSGDHPTLTATLTDPAGQANIRMAKVALPLSLALDPNNSNNVCPFATAQAVHGGPVGCSASTIVGTATAVTPLLSQPLTGNIYLVQGIRTNAQGQQIKTLPSLLVPLRGQIALDLRAQTSVSGGKLVTTFPTIPDAAVSSFTLKINGGKKGLLVVTGRGLNICQKNQVGTANFGAQSGKTTAGNMTLSTPCGKPAKLKILSRTMSAGALTLRVTTSERGKVTVIGQQVATYSKVLTAGTHQIRVHVKQASVRGSRSNHAATMKVTVEVAPASAKPATKTLSIGR